MFHVSKRGGAAAPPASGPDCACNIFYLGIFIAQAYPLWQSHGINTVLSWAGTIIFIMGYVLRLWAVRTLGQFFTMEIGLRADHGLITNGPYRWARHPSYTGYLLILLGYALAAQSLVALIIPLTLAGVFLFFRIRAEERMLVEKFGESYRLYQKKSKRLFPCIF